MANGHAVSGHNATHNNNNNDVTSSTDSDSMEDTVEYRLMMAYAQRRRPKGAVRSPAPGGPDANGTASPQTPAETEKEPTKEGEKKKKNKTRKFIRRILPKCVKAEKKDSDETRMDDDGQAGHQPRSFRGDGGTEEGEDLKELAKRLIQLAGKVHFTPSVPSTPSDIEADSPGEDNLEKLVGLLLREHGDRLNQEVLKEVPQIEELFRSYRFFDRLVSSFLGKMGFTVHGPNAQGPQESPKAQIALACEVTSRLSVVDTLPMNQLMGFGAKYLQTHFSAWVKQQGGYEEAIDGEDEEEVQ